MNLDLNVTQPMDREFIRRYTALTAALQTRNEALNVDWLLNDARKVLLFLHGTEAVQKEATDE